MSDDGFGGGGGDDFDYDGPRFVPLFHPPQRYIADSFPSFTDGAFVRTMVHKNSQRAHKADRMRIMIS